MLAGAGGRQIGRANANALAAEGNAGEGWWRNQLARAVIWVTVSKPCSSSLPGPGQPMPCSRSCKQRCNHQLGTSLGKHTYRQARFTTAGTTSASWPFNRG